MDDLANVSLWLARVASGLGFAYLVAGCGVAAGLYGRGGLRRLDPLTATSPAAFRWLILPGILALWPWLLRLWRQAKQEAER